MNPRLAVLAVIPVLLHLHLSVAVAGTVVTVSVPWLLILALILVAVVLAWLTLRHVRGFRSSPFPRTVT
jgi:hypothetical protein